MRANRLSGGGPVTRALRWLAASAVLHGVVLAALWGREPPPPKPTREEALAMVEVLPPRIDPGASGAGGGHVGRRRGSRVRRPARAPAPVPETPPPAFPPVMMPRPIPAPGPARPRAGSPSAVEGEGGVGAVLGTSGAGAGAGTGRGTGAGAGPPTGVPGLDLAPILDRLRASARACAPRARRGLADRVARVRFCIGPDGSPSSVALLSSSGAGALDRAAVDCVVPGAAPFPPIASCLVVPLRFR